MEVRDNTEAKAPAEAAASNLNLLNECSNGGKHTEYQRTQELAKFGPYTTNRIDSSSYTPGAAHPSDDHKFVTSSASGEQMKLTDFFNKEDIYNAMMTNPSIRTAIIANNYKPDNFDQLDELLNQAGPGIPMHAELMNGPQLPRDQQDAYLNQDALSNFAFVNVLGGDKTYVGTRFLLEPNSGAGRNTLPYVDIFLPANGETLKEIKDAASQDNGFLMKDAEARGVKTSSTKEVPDAPCKPEANYIEQESTRIAEMLNHAGRFANAGPEMVRPAAVELSSALKHLSGDDYNKLLLSIQERQSQYVQDRYSDKQFMGHLDLDKWNDKTGTWDYVTLVGRQAGYPMTPEIRIAQPGNTLWGMATDRLNEPVEGKTQLFGSSEIRKMIQDTAALNGFADPGKISVGDAVTMPMWTEDRGR